MRILRGTRAEEHVRQLAQRGAVDTARREPVVRKIIADVRRGGDRALRRYAEKWDGLRPQEPLRVTQREINVAWRSCRRELRQALQQAARNIRRFAEWQLPREWRREISPGLEVGQLVRPLESVGCYVPGGRYPLPSTMLMTVILAQVAGVKQIVVASPRPAPETLAAAGMLGVENFFRIGGAQAITALAYGTETVPCVRKIVGPGNTFVTAAKKLVAFDCAIDFLAGPTEVLIVSDMGEAEFIAADLVAQAEHDSDALPIFITTSRSLAAAVAEKTKVLAARNSVARDSLRRNGVILLADRREQAWEWANEIGPEHITADVEEMGRIINAGSVFLGNFSPHALGDYCAGPNHVLPTGGNARTRGGLSVHDFVKVITVQQATRSGLAKVEPTATLLAEAEGLKAHAASVRVRCAHA